MRDQNAIGLFDLHAKIYCLESFIESCVVLAKKVVYIIS